MFCSICRTEIDSIDDAIDAGWLPSFYDGDVQHEVACPSCSETIIPALTRESNPALTSGHCRHALDQARQHRKRHPRIA